MPDETIDTTEGLPPPPRDSVSLKLAPEREDEAPSERTFERKATRIKLDDEEHVALARVLEQALDAIDHERNEQEWDANWDLYEDLYFGVLQDRPAGQANIHVPLSQEVVDTTLAVVEQAIFGPRPWLQVHPREPMDVDAAKRKEKHLDYALSVEMRAKEKLEPSLFEAAALGTGVTYLPWLRETERIRDEETYDGLKQSDMERFDQRYPDANKDFPEIVAKLRKGQRVTLTVEYDEARQDAPEPTYVPLRNWRVRPTAQWHQLHRERYVGHFFPLRWANLEALIDSGYYDQVLTRLRFKWDSQAQAFVDDVTYQDKSYEIETGTLRWRRGTDSRERRYLVDFHRESRTVLRILHFPYWHNRPNYLPWYLQKSRRYIYGESLIHKIESSQFEANAAHSLTLDAVSFGAIPMFKARKGTEGTFNPMRDGMYAGKTWYFDNPDSDASAFGNGVNAGVSVLLNLEDRATRHAELASGATQNLSGLESARDPNAPASKTIHQTTQALIRIGKYLATLAPTFSEFGFQVSELYAQFSPQGRQFRVMGPDGTPVFESISRQELRLRADYWPHTSTAALNPDQQERKTTELGMLLLKMPEVQESPLRRLEVLEMILDSAGDAWAQKKAKVLPGSEEMDLIRQEEEKRLKLKQQALVAPPPLPGAAPGAPPGAPPNGNGGRMPADLLAMLGGQR